MLILHITVLRDGTPCSLVKYTGDSKVPAIAATVTAAASLSTPAAHANSTKCYTSQIVQSGDKQ